MRIREATIDEVGWPAAAFARPASERNARILAMHRNGMRGSEIARLLGLTRERVRQIVKRDAGESIRKGPRPVACRICHGRFLRAERVAHTTAPDHRAALTARRVERFWTHVAKGAPHECWMWTGSTGEEGYGRSGVAVPGGSGLAHRVAYILTHGEIPAGLSIDHLCRNRGCVNPAHLEPVTQRENVLRSPSAPAALNARKTHCKYGHRLAPVGSSRNRVCLTCRANRQRVRSKGVAA